MIQSYNTENLKHSAAVPEPTQCSVHGSNYGIISVLSTQF